MQEQLRQIPMEKLRLGSIGLLALLVASLIVYVVMPQWRAYTAARTSLVTLEKSTASGIALDTQLSAIQSEVASLEKQLHGDASNLPLKQVEAFVIGRLQNISWKNRIELVGVQPRSGDGTEQFHELLFELELRGDYFDFFGWLNDIGRELGFIVVQRFEMSPQNAGNENDLGLTVRLTMAAYRNVEV